MSGIFHPNGIPYFPLAKNIFTLGKCPELKGSAFMLYGYICYLSQERTKANVYIANDELMHVTGMAKGTILNARAVLEQEGFIKFSRGSNGYTYTLLNPETGKSLVSSVKGEYPPLDFNTLDQLQLKSYYKHHLRGGLKETHNGIMACCPFHDDSNPSMDINLERGSVWQCHSCGVGGKLIDFEMRIAKIKGDTISPSEAHKRVRVILVSTGAIDATLGVPEAVYPYHSVDGKLLFEVVRYEGKVFKQRQPDPNKLGYHLWNVVGVPKVLYGLPQIAAAEVVIILEGERDCDNLRLLNLRDQSFNPVAVTTCPMGAAKWQSSYSRSLKEKKVVIFPDQDFAGQTHSKKIKESLAGVASEVHVRDFPDGFKDMTEYLGEHSATDLALLIDLEWIPVAVHV